MQEKRPVNRVASAIVILLWLAVAAWLLFRHVFEMEAGCVPEKGKNMETLHIGGKYRHFKGNEYRVLHVARHSETLEPYVVYQALYGEGGIWVRPLEMFTGFRETDGVPVKRFQAIGDD